MLRSFVTTRTFHHENRENVRPGENHRTDGLAGATI